MLIKVTTIQAEVQSSLDDLGTLTVEYNEKVIQGNSNSLELKNIKDSRNKLIAKKADQDKELSLLNQDLDLLRMQSLLSPVKIMKTPKKSFLGITTMKFFEHMTALENENIYSMPTTAEVDNESMVVEQLESKISELKKENSDFIVYVDELNDSSFSALTRNKQFKLKLKDLEKELLDTSKERLALKKVMNIPLIDETNLSVIEESNYNLRRAAETISPHKGLKNK